jgi:inorganic pyrophosphatase/exopolyphosphatase
MIKVFGHKAPDTDSTGSAIIWAWYLNEMTGPSRPGGSAWRAQYRGRFRHAALGL